MKVFLNTAYLEEDAALISPLSPGFMYGYGVFETIRVSGKQALFLDQTSRAHGPGAFGSGADLPVSRNRVPADYRKIAGAEWRFRRIRKGRLQQTGSSKKQSYQEADILILTGTKTYKEEYATGLKVCLADARRNEFSKIVGIKSMNYDGKYPGKEKRRRREVLMRPYF